MRIAINTRLLQKNKLEGIGYFTLKTLKRMVINHPEHEFIFFFDRPYDESYIFAKNVIPIIIPCPTRHPILWYIYFELLLPKYLKKYKADIYFSPDSFMPLRPKIPTLNVFHDLNYEHNPEYIGNWWHRRYYLKFFPKFAKRANRLVAVSEYTKQDIVELYNIYDVKIDVVYNAANEKYHVCSEKEKQEIKEELTFGKDYFYFVGALHKRKNLSNLFKAFDIFKQETQSDVKLVIIGAKKWWSGDIEHTYRKMRYKEDVIFTGRMDAENINKIANGALALTFVSLFEGFGIPIVEAFAAGCPVITSRTTSMPEVGADAALYCDPFLPTSIAERMVSIYKNPSLREELIAKGFEQNKKFNWDKSAQDLWNVIEKTINHKQ